MAGNRIAANPHFLAAALNQVGDAVIIIDEEQRIAYLNEAAANQYDVDAAAALGRPLTDLCRYQWLHSLDEAASTAALEQFGLWQGRNIHVLRNGRRLLVESTVTALHDGEQRYLLAVIRDITARQRTAQELLEAQERLRLALEKAPLSFGQNDRELRYTWMYNQHPDFRAADYLGKRDDELAQNAEVARFMDAKRRVLASGRGLRAEFTFPLSDGDHTYDCTIEPLWDANGEIVGVTCASLDVTEHKRAQAALRELNETLEQRVAERTAELERSNRDLDRFAYVASHDLKSPLRAIDYLAQWIADDAASVLSFESKRNLSRLRGRVQRLENLLESLLHYSRAGRKRYAPELVDSAALVSNIVELIDPPPGFRVIVDGHLPTLRGERPPLETVLRNLLENAVKHHHDARQGLVTVSAREARPGWVEFCVRDNGPGIDPQYHERIFEVFQTLRPRDEVEGSGMGLAIVKKTVESAGGSIRIESAPDQGSAFCFTWPLHMHA